MDTWDVVIVGAGVCGLTTALALERHGLSVAVLEKRGDASLPEARKDLDDAALSMSRINELPLDAESLPGELQKVRDLLSRYWGLKERNVLIDTHTLRYLAALGLDVQGFKHLEQTSLDGMDGGLQLAVGFSPQRILPEDNGLDADRVILQRDFSSQPTLGELERRLHDRVRDLSRVHLFFDHRAIRVTESTDRVTVQMADGRTVSGCYLVVADGGAASSLASSDRLDGASGKTVYSREPISVAIFRANPGQRLLGYDLSQTFTHTTFTTNSWTGLFCNGTNLTVAVDDPRPEDSHRSEAMSRMHALGLRAPLAEPPFQVDAAIAIVPRFTSGRRVLLAGDAAMTGNPRFGLGVQYGVLWAQQLDVLFGAAVSAHHDPDLAAYEEFGHRITERRQRYEAPWLITMADFMSNGWSFSDPDVASAALLGLQSLSVQMVVKGSEILLRCTLKLDFQNAPQPIQHQIAEVLHSYGYFSLSFDLAIETGLEGAEAPFTGRAILSQENAIRLVVGNQGWTITEGTVDFRRLTDGCGWELALHDTGALQHAVPAGRYQTNRMPMEQMALRVPDALLDQMLGFAPESLTAATLYEQPLVFEFDVAEDAELEWGPLHVRSEGPSRLRLTVSRHDRGTPKVDIDVLCGRLMPVSFTGFARDSGLSSARWVSSWSRLTRGMFDEAMDMWGRWAGGSIRGLSIKLAADGSAIATLRAVVPVSILLSRADMQHLRRTLASASALAELISASPAFVSSMRTT